MVEQTLASRLADAGHFAAREAETAEQNAKLFGHSADAKNAVFFRALGIAYFAMSEALFSGAELMSAMKRVHLPREFNSEMSGAYQAAISRVNETKNASDVSLSALVPTLYH